MHLLFQFGQPQRRRVRRGHQQHEEVRGELYLVGNRWLGELRRLFTGSMSSRIVHPERRVTC